MLSDLQQRKLTRSFRIFDHNRDGFLEPDDFDGIARKLAELRGHAAGSPAYQGLLEKYGFVWNTLAALNGGKSRVTLEEFLAYNDTVIASPGTFDQTIVKLVDFAFDLLDSDGDGAVTVEEYRLYLRACGIDPTLADGVFQKLDLNGDGHLSKAEVHEIVRQFYYSSDPDSPGNYLLVTY